MAAIGYIAHLERKLRPGRSSGRCSTFTGMAQIFGNPKLLPVYFKLFPQEECLRGHFNELFAYAVARRFGLPTPERTFLCACSRAQLVEPTDDLECRLRESRYISGIASVDGNPKGVKQLVKDTELARVELLRWPQLANVAVVDELLLNSDRTVHNLVRVGPRDYLIIDHDQILGGPNWTVESVDHRLFRPTGSNHLAELIAQSTDEVSQHRMLRVAEEFSLQPALDESIFELNLDDICHLHPGTAARLLALLNERRKALPKLMASYLYAAQMFRASS